MKCDSENEALIGGIEARAIEIVDSDDRWQDVYRSHANSITQSLGTVALRTRHVGSTSVIGLAAKPIIDILIAVEDSSDEASYLTNMKAAEYELRVREPNWHEHRMFRTRARDIHVHVFSLGSSEVERMLTFRDRLRSNVRDRKRYEETKRRLARRFWRNMDDYARAKTRVIEDILAATQSATTVSQ